MEMDSDNDTDRANDSAKVEGNASQETEVHMAMDESTGSVSTDFPWPLKCFVKEDVETEPNKDWGDKPVVSYTSNCYNMGHKRRGFAVIISQQKFSSSLQDEGFGERNGTSVDEKALRKQLKWLGFDVEMYKDVRASYMINIFATVADKDHSDSDCFLCAILTHGEEGIVYGTDKSIEIKELASYFKSDKCPSLTGKPKIFIIQACRGMQTDDGVEVNVADGDVTDAARDYPLFIRLPVEADFLFAYSTVPGYYSWRNSYNGSWFIQALAEMLEEHGQNMELLQLLTRVNKMVAQSFESSSDKRAFSKKKQISCITSMLTKDVYFKRK